MSIRVVRHESARGFLSRARSWLMESEAENNLVLGIAGQLAEGVEWDPATFLATIESEGYVVGCAFRTPPFKLGLSRMPLKAVPPLTDLIGGTYEKMPGVLGPMEEARYFARMWCGPRALSFRPVMDQRIYSIDSLVVSETGAPGAMRPADETDRPLVIEWLRRFFDETRMPVRNAEHVAAQLLPGGAMFMWSVDGTDASMAGITGRTPNGARIGFVYTPIELRKQGYGSAITAALTRKLFDEGKRFCFLFTDASNPTSNRIYLNLGYRPVADVVDYQFF